VGELDMLGVRLGFAGKVGRGMPGFEHHRHWTA